MKPEEKYNQIIKLIEKYVREKPYRKKSEILNCILQEKGYFGKAREFNAIFEFINGQLPSKYISVRQMMYAYEYMLEHEKYKDIDINKLVEITGKNDQPAFYNDFKKLFGYSPGRAFDLVRNKHADSLYKEPEFWGTFDNDILEEEAEISQENNNLHKDTFFGMDKEAYKRIIALQNLAAEYGCSNENAEAAFRFHEEYNVPLEKAFEYASYFPGDRESLEELYNGSLECGELSEENNTFEKYYINETLNKMKDKTTMHCYFDLGFSGDDSAEISWKAQNENMDFSDIDKPHAYALIYLGEILSARELIRLTDAYIRRNNDEIFDYSQFTDFLDWASELSFDEIIRDGDAVELAYSFSNLLKNSIETEELEDKYQRYMLDKEYIFESGFIDDEERHKDWMHYKNPHKYEYKNVDDSECEEDGIWNDFPNEKNS